MLKVLEDDVNHLAEEIGWLKRREVRKILSKKLEDDTELAEMVEALKKLKPPKASS
jgi:hypothetical protein